MKSIRDSLHYLITAYIILGWLVPEQQMLHAVFCALVLLHWRTNNNRCFLSEYDYSGNGYPSAYFVPLALTSQRATMSFPI